MKKTILLSTLLASVALASTTGFVESYIENETEFGTYAVSYTHLTLPTKA